MKRMRLLITGGAGCLGSSIAWQYLSQGHQVCVIDNYATGRREHLPEADGLIIQQGSISDPGLVMETFRRFQPTHVIHSAAAYKDPQNRAEDVATNVLGAVYVGQAALAVKVERLINFQTALCYGRPDKIPIPVNHPTRPFTSYGISKTAGEQYLLHSDLAVVSFRIANVCGPRLAIGPLPTFYRRLRKGQSCFCSDAIRDFIDMEDFLALLDLALQPDAPTGVFNVSTGTGHTILELFRAIAECLDLKPMDPPLVPCMVDDVPNVVLDPSATTAAFAWRASINFRETVRRQILWYDEHGIGDVFSHLATPGSESSPQKVEK
jgi:UDP-glucose 4-epimerase